MATKVQKVSRDDIVKARGGANFSAEKVSTSPEKKSAKRASETLPYVLRFKDSDISNFFDKYGYINHERFQDAAGTNFIRVNCENFDVIFSDFDIAVNCYPEYDTMTSDFNFKKFMEYCKANDIAPEQTIADIIYTDLFGAKFPSYAEIRQAHKDNIAHASHSALPKNMRKLLKSVHEKVLATNKLEGNKGKYGVFDVEQFKGSISEGE